MYKVMYLPTATYMRARYVEGEWASPTLFANVKRDVDQWKLEKLSGNWYVRTNITGSRKPCPVRDLTFGNTAAATKFISILCCGLAECRIQLLILSGVYDTVGWTEYKYHDYVADQQKPKHERSDNYYKSLIVINQFEIVEVDSVNTP